MGVENQEPRGGHFKRVNIHAPLRLGPNCSCTWVFHLCNFGQGVSLNLDQECHGPTCLSHHQQSLPFWKDGSRRWHTLHGFAVRSLHFCDYSNHQHVFLWVLLVTPVQKSAITSLQFFPSSGTHGTPKQSAGDHCINKRKMFISSKVTMWPVIHFCSSSSPPEENTKDQAQTIMEGTEVTTPTLFRTVLDSRVKKSIFCITWDFARLLFHYPVSSSCLLINSYLLFTGCQVVNWIYFAFNTQFSN